MDNVLSAAKEKMAKAIEILKQDLSSIRSGRATTALVDHIIVSVYGGSTRMKINEIATVTTSEAKAIIIAPFDLTIIDEIVKGIFEAKTGLTPVRDGDVIRLNIPSMSEEQRKEYQKLAKTKIEHGKIMIRQIRAEAMKDLKKLADEGLVTEDLQKTGEKQVQVETDKMTKEVDEIGDRKLEELISL